jgi:hypothetical protein
MDQNYSASISAADALVEAKDTLIAAIENLENIVTDVNYVNNNSLRFNLAQNYPNPFNPETHINYSIPQSGYISLKVYDLLGQDVATLFEGVRQSGNYEVIFDGKGLTSGVYLYRLVANNFIQTKKLILLR